MKVQVVGDLNWTQLRTFIIDEMEKCKTKIQFEELLTKLWKSVGTIEHIQDVRKELGIKPLTDEEIEKLK